MIYSPDTWPEDEADLAANLFLELLEQGEPHDYLHQWIIKERQHWISEFNDMIDMQRFAARFNARVFNADKFNCAM
jgi:hypothetical protein